MEEERSENQQRRRQIKARIHEDNSIDNGLRLCLADEDGKAFINWIFEITDILGSSFREGDTHLTAFCLGNENVGKQLLARIEQVDGRAWYRLREKALKTKEYLDE